MVSTRKVHQADRPPFEAWLDSLELSVETKEKLSAVSSIPERLLVGQEMVEILCQLNMDDATLQAALVFPYCEQHALSEDDIYEEFGGEIRDLIVGVRRMDAIKSLHARKVKGSGFAEKSDEQHIDSIRRMLLAMVEDVRAVVIKMAERICALQQVKKADEETRVMVARECASIYAPLANRLGIGQLKWELEDLAFRYLHPITYKQIAHQLDGKRRERAEYIETIVGDLQGLLDSEEIRAEVYGRPKHIFSIWKKMQKKRLTFEQLFDIRAVRIIAERLQDCYAALGTVHASYKHLPNEFDDYIATPKPNGYQSIHTVIVGPEGKSVEIQIRTQKMHQDAELGVAAHWKYKEGSTGKQSGYDERINWLRRILAWQEEVAESGDLVEELRSQVFDDRVYVFTPKGDVIDLPQGATPLDFAYYIHSNVGHRCIGAKVNGRIVPFTYLLQSGDQIEVLTGKEPNPSRDWMHPGLGYVHSSRARATIHSFFKKQDRDKNLAAGKELLERELQRAHLPAKVPNEAFEKFNLQTLDDLYTAVGAGDVRVMQVINFIHHLQEPPAPEPEISPKVKTRKTAAGSGKKDAVVVQGVGHLMSQLANCCKPVPGEAILGYITQGRGVSVHKESCDQLQHLLSQHPERQIEVNWSQELKVGFETGIDIFCHDRTGLLRDITTVLANENVPLLGVNSLSDKNRQTALITISIEVQDLDTVSKVLTRLRQLKGVTDAKRKQS
ncbi:MAG: GTP diphosphokinase [Alteromonas macleodii]|jgi:GTP pyrophosphokinase|uniref:GTP diphosphokinase n=1 Tax=Alteromonas TaxID=226 RepID=UPI00066AAA32|nr:MULTISPECIES: GTP diphosphokinase [Alteromonas]MCP3703921.1 GTP diphosphokinase [Alteromonas sp.]AMN10740.1 (p)ppGpp synthetase [Alteromonas macleodii]NOH59305.1 GTP diphosphokinase [Alteromonas sp. 07-89-2]CAI3936362.1 (p)ppGpp synthetase I [Alteromonas macleodii]VTP50772.1 (p)ppGpp synthetase I [Alteromonas macleodii]|tara:strand:- start:10635 stop:12818 length:2184 start_codon:yes stop_codon:yes gene_type:complete